MQSMKRRWNGGVPFPTPAMKPRTLTGPERLEDRMTMNADPVTVEYLPSAHGTAEAASSQWQSIRTATHANIIHHFENDQAGIQRHLWSGNYYGWEGLAEFTTNLPEGAVIDTATLHITVTNKIDTMNRQPSLLVHASTQDQDGAIITSEYGNAEAFLGSAPFGDIVPGQTVAIPLDVSGIPPRGTVSVSLRTSDQAAGLEPASDHNAVSAFCYSGMRLDVRYEIPEPEPKPDPSTPLELPGELEDLLAEAITLARNGPEWRTPETGEAVTAALLRGLHLNLRGADAPVVGLHATVTANGAAITASVYRGTKLLATMPVPTDGRFAYSYDNGFTDVVFATAAASTVSSTDVEITTDETMQPIAGDAIGPMTSKPYALAAAPVVPIPNNVAYVAGKLKFYDVSTIGGESRRYITRDPSQYTLIRSMMTAGSGSISMIGTIKKEGVDYMGREYGSTSGFPEGYARWIAENAVVIAPGAPALISLIVGGYGSKGSIVTSQAASLEALLPPSTMSAATIDTDLMTMNDQFQTAGIFEPLAEIREGSSPTFSNPGDIANVQYHVRNTAIGGGTLTARVYVGWYAGEPTRGTLQQTETVAMAGSQTRRISANVIAPHKPADATSERPIISMVLTLPNGTTAGHSKLGKEPKSHEKRVYTRNADGTTTMRIESVEYTRREQERIHALTDRALNALLSSNDSRLVAVRTAMGDDHIVDLIAKNTAAALALADAMNLEESTDEAVTIVNELMDAETTLTLDGIGGAENDGAVLWDPDALSKDKNVHAYDISKNGLLTRLSSEEITILKKTALGRFFLGISQRAVEAKSDAEIVQIANSVYDATGILPRKTSIFLRAASEPARRVDMLKQLFAPSVQGQGDALLRTIFQERTVANDSIFATSISLTESKHVRIRFDFATEDFDFHHGNVYLMSASGQQLSDRPLLQSPFADQFFIDIPMLNIALEVRNIFGVEMLDILDTNFQFKIAIWNEANDANGLHGNNMTDALSLPDVVTMNRPGYVQTGNHSTLPDTSQNALRRQKENVVLSILSNPEVFPLRSPAIDSGQWYWNIASPYHDGSNQFNAVDLTMAGTTDRGKQVNAPEDGEVVPGGDGTDDWHTVILKHTGTLPSGELFVWFSKYLHMDHVGIHNPDGSITTLVAGMFVPKDAVFGSVSSVGSGIDNDHMHMSIHLDSADGTSVDMRRILIDEFHLVVKAEDAGPDGSQMNYHDNTSLLVVWNDDVKAFVTTTQSNGSNPRLILDRSQQDQTANVPAAESNQYWVAFSNIAEERKRIAFRTIPKVQLTDGSIINNYSGWFGLDANGNIIEWKNNNWSSIAII